MSDSRETDALRETFLEEMGLAGADDGTPTVVGPYRVVEPLGEGAFGRVYHAIHQDLLKHVALKVIEAGPGTPSARIERFRREARTAARLRHPNIVGVHDVGDDGRRHWIAMDLEEGETLGEWLRGAPSLEERLRVVALVARAVDHAHRQGVLHRDLKPQNVLMRDGATPVVVDFGLARGADDESLTVDGALLGTPAYMAPEQLRGDVRAHDARTDVYALGVLLYEAVTGRRPFPDEPSGELLGRVTRRAFPPPTSIRSDLPGALDVLCARCLEPDPALRPAGAAMLADDLERLLRGEPPTARPVSTARRLLRELRSKKAVAALAALLLVTIALSFALTSRQRETLDLVSYAHAVQSAYGELTLRLDRVLARAEEERYVPSTAADMEELVAEAERRLAAADDRTGVADAFRAWILFLVNHPRAEEALAGAIERHPRNPFGPLTAARVELLRYAERAQWPSFRGVALYPTETPFRTLEPNETPEMRAALERAREALLAARATAAWSELPSLRWIDDLCRGFERYADGDMDGAVGALSAIGDRADLQFDVQLLLALAHGRRGDVDLALRAAESLARLRPNLRPAVALLGACHRFRAYRRLARREDPLEDLLTARVVFSSWRNRADFAGDLGQLHAAIGIAREMAREDPTDDFRAALALLDDEIERRGADFRNLTNRAVVRTHVARRTGDAALLERAVEDVERAWIDSAGDPLVALTRTQVHVARVYVRAKGEGARDDDLTAARRAVDEAAAADVPERELAYARAGLAFVEAEDRIRRRLPAEDALEAAIAHADRAAGPDGSFLEARQIACAARVYLAANRPTSTADVRATAEEALFLRRAGLSKSIDPRTIAGWLERFARDPRRDDRHELALSLADARSLAVEEAPDDPIVRALHLLALVGVGRAEEAPSPALAEARAAAAELAAEHAPGEVGHAAARAVEAELFALAGRTTEALAAIEAARSVAAAAPILARVARRLNADAWPIAADPDAGRVAWRRARESAELARAAAPDDGIVLNTLGVARYRDGDLEGALAALTRSDASNRARFDGGHPADAAFLALVHHARGDADAAAEAAARFERLMTRPEHRDDPECRAFATEVRGTEGADRSR